MKHSIHSMTFRRLIMVLPCLALCVSGNTKAQVQVTVTQGDCSEQTPCTAIAHQQGANTTQLDMEGAPLIGAGQGEIVSTAGKFGVQDEAAVVKNQPYQAQAGTARKPVLPG